MTAPEAVLRPLQPADVPAAFDMAWTSLSATAVVPAPSLPLPDDALARGHARYLHLQRTDPDGAWVAVQGDDVVGVALSLRRGPVWFLSLLAVDGRVQGRGVGRRLLEASMTTAEGATGAYLLSSAAPAALHRYGTAGFALEAGYSVSGPLDRTRVPAVEGVREGDWDRDGERVDALGVHLRGAAYGPDLQAYARTDRRLLLGGGGPSDGFAVVREGRVDALGARDEATATRLLWAALAEAGSGPDGEVQVEVVTGGQQWAVQVALQARLPLRPDTSLATRGRLGPLHPYLPSGAYG